MKSLFDPADRASICQRLGVLQAGSPRQWGKMNAAQMLTHCARAMEVGTGAKTMKQAFLGRLLTPFIRSSVLGEKPFSRSSPTDPSFVVKDDHDFMAERQGLLDLIDRFVARGSDAAGHATHSFFGKLSGKEWGELMYKHLDHHLQQFGA
jgi:hypothetical protein